MLIEIILIVAPIFQFYEKGTNYGWELIEF